MRFLDGVVIATSLTVVLSVLAAITLLPALLGLLGDARAEPAPAARGWPRTGRSR